MNFFSCEKNFFSYKLFLKNIVIKLENFNFSSGERMFKEVETISKTPILRGGGGAAAPK